MIDRRIDSLNRAIPDIIHLIKQNKVSYITPEEWDSICTLIFTILGAFIMKDDRIADYGDQFNAVLRKQLDLD